MKLLKRIDRDKVIGILCVIPFSLIILTALIALAIYALPLFALVIGMIAIMGCIPLFAYGIELLTW